MKLFSLMFLMIFFLCNANAFSAENIDCSQIAQDAVMKQAQPKDAPTEKAPEKDAGSQIVAK